MSAAMSKLSAGRTEHVTGVAAHVEHGRKLALDVLDAVHEAPRHLPTVVSNRGPKNRQRVSGRQLDPKPGSTVLYGSVARRTSARR